MQGRKGQDNEPWERISSQRDPTVSGNGTGKRRAIPQRPPGMRHLDQPPPTPRVTRPAREKPRPRSWRRRVLIFGGLFLIFGILACGIGYAIVNLLGGLNAASAPAATATDFFSSLSTQNYDQAYNDLAANIVAQTDPTTFKQQAQDADTTCGRVTNYVLAPNGSTLQDNTWSFSYNVTRAKLSKPYTLTVTLRQDSQGNWRVTSYESNNDSTRNELAPACK